jgi:adenylosuccinate synthase
LWIITEVAMQLVRSELMPVSVVVGGQYGSEGKGKVAHFLAEARGAAAAIRVGGTNSGHTVVNPKGETIVLRQLPTSAILPNVVSILPAGSYVDLDILFREIKLLNLPASRLLIDPNATIIKNEDLISESNTGLREEIGSTLSGTGAAVQRRIARKQGLVMAQNEPRLDKYVSSVSIYLRNLLNMNNRIVVEGTQGFGLSLLHSDDYPFVTSRDTTAASFISEAGLSPLDVDEVVMVIRAFPIRVAGNSGPLENELSWDYVSNVSGNTNLFAERTSVTKSIRRVSEFDPKVVLKAIAVNRPTKIALNHLDYIDYNCVENKEVTKKARGFVAKIEDSIGESIDYLGFSPSSLASP